MSWMVFSYSLPSKSSSSPRVTLWRRLRRLGAISLKGGIQVLHAREECVEAFQWLAQEVQQAKGEALVMQLVGSITGAQILVNTVGYVQGTGLGRDARLAGNLGFIKCRGAIASPIGQPIAPLLNLQKNYSVESTDGCEVVFTGKLISTASSSFCLGISRLPNSA